jgi:alkyldihydroxyacetonephosphate synthase
VSTLVDRKPERSEGAIARIDRKSLLADVDGRATLAEVERTLAAEGLTLDVDRSAWAQVSGMTLADWLAEGAHGARDPWLDPADHLVAGLEAELIADRTLAIRPAPRRAVGPDLIALVVGARGRFARVRRATVRVHLAGVTRPSAAPFEAPRDPPLEAGETALLARIEDELRTL